MDCQPFSTRTQSASTYLSPKFPKCHSPLWRACSFVGKTALIRSHTSNLNLHKDMRKTYNLNYNGLKLKVHYKIIYLLCVHLQTFYVMVPFNQNSHLSEDIVVLSG